MTEFEICVAGFYCMTVSSCAESVSAFTYSNELRRYTKGQLWQMRW